VSEEPEALHPGHDIEEGAGPSGDLETGEEHTEQQPGAEEPVSEGGQGAPGAGGPSPERRER
jgi:hypothetical protein